MSTEVLATLPLWFAIFLFSTTCHEAAHAWVARLGGDFTAHAGGQVSLDPIPHVRRHPLGMIVFPLVSFLMNGGSWMIGWASAPYDGLWAQRHPKRAAYMSAAGPAANLLLVVVAVIGIRVGVAAGTFAAPSYPSTDTIVTLADGSTNLGTLALSVLFTLNLLLFTFNLLPVPPLDGSGAIGLLLPDDLARKWSELFEEPMFMIVGLVVAWQVFGQIWGPIFGTALGLLYPEVIYVRG